MQGERWESEGTQGKEGPGHPPMFPGLTAASNLSILRPLSDAVLSKPIRPSQWKSPTFLRPLRVIIMRAWVAERVVSHWQRPTPLTGWKVTRHDWHVRHLPEWAITMHFDCSDNIEWSCSHILYSLCFFTQESSAEACSVHALTPGAPSFEHKLLAPFLFSTLITINLYLHLSLPLFLPLSLSWISPEFTNLAQ